VQAQLMRCSILIFFGGAFATFKAVVHVELLPIDENPILIFADLLHHAMIFLFNVQIAEMKHLWLWSELSMDRLLEFGIASGTILRNSITVSVW
jgi:hypothetical protein